MSTTIRLARVSDAASIQKIYAPFVTDTGVTFEIEVPSVDEFARRVEETLKKLPWFVLERDGEVVGYAYAGRHRDRPAYAWGVETSIYLAVSQRRHGDGRRLYRKLFDALKTLGYINAYAGITLPNAASVGFHEAMGFARIGTYSKIGFKLGAWHDVGWWQLALAEHAVPPALPRGMNLALLAGRDE